MGDREFVVLSPVWQKNLANQLSRIETSREADKGRNGRSRPLSPELTWWVQWWQQWQQLLLWQRKWKVQAPANVIAGGTLRFLSGRLQISEKGPLWLTGRGRGKKADRKTFKESVTCYLLRISAGDPARDLWESCNQSETPLTGVLGTLKAPGAKPTRPATLQYLSFLYVLS